MSVFVVERAMSDSDTASEVESAHADKHNHHHRGPGYATPQAAIEEGEREELAYVMSLYTGTDIDEPDFVAVVDLDPDSETYCEIVDRLEMPEKGDELHHFGWNACSSSCHVEGLERRHLIVPGQRSSRIHVIDTKDRRNPELVEVIEPEDVFEYDLSAPHTVHCVPEGKIIISMLGDADGELPGGFLELNHDFEIEGRWEPPGEIGMNYDYWYQPRQNVMVSTEWAAPKTYYPGFDLEDVEDGKYGRRLHFWDWENGTVEQTIDLGEEGQIPLEVRFLHTPESTHGFVGAALSSNIFHFWYDTEAGEYRAEKVIDFEAREHEDWEMPVPPLTTDILISMDDRYLFGSNWLHG
jgi:methanethiol oxidase